MNTVNIALRLVWAALLSLLIAACSQTPGLPATDAKPASQAIGLSASYFTDNDFRGLRLSQIDRQIFFDWGKASPAHNVGAEAFSVTWEGFIKPKESGAYSFFLTAEGSASLWIKGQNLADGETLQLLANSFYPIRLKFQKTSAQASLKLEWQVAGVKEVIPQELLYPLAGFSAQALSEGSNLLLNADFEAGTGNWIKYGAGTLSTASPGSNGSGAALSTSDWAWIQQDVPASLIVAGQAYSFKGFARALNGASCVFGFTGGGAGGASFSEKLVFSSGAWTEQGKTLTMPAGISWMAVYLSPTQQACQFDDLSLIAGDGSVPPPPVVDAEAILNGGFEDNLEHWQAFGGSVSIGSSAYAGQKALEVSQFAWVQQAITLSSLQAGKTYSFSAYGKTATSCSVGFSAYDSSAQVLNETLNFTGSNWQELSKTLVMPANIAWAAVYIAATDASCSLDELRLRLPLENPDLLMYLPLDNDARDSSGRANHGSLNANPKKVSARREQGYYFDANAFVKVPHSDSLQLGKDGEDFSLAFWLNLQEKPNGSYRSIMHKGSQESERTFALWMQPNSNRLHFRISTTASSNEGSDSNAALALNTWTHLAYVKRANKLELYLDGQLDSSVTLTAAVKPNSGAIYIGKSPWFNAAASCMDEIYLYGKALSLQELSTLSQVGSRKTCVVGDAGQGGWEPVFDWPVIAASMANLPDGKVLAFASWDEAQFGGTERSYTEGTIYDPVTGAFLDKDNLGHDMFCAGLVQLPNGNIFAAGGGSAARARSSEFDIAQNNWLRKNDMLDKHWYGTAVALPDGQIFVAYGVDSGPVPEMRSSTNVWRKLPGINTSSLQSAVNEWPNVVLAPSGKLVYTGGTPNLYELDLSGIGSMTQRGTIAGQPNRKDINTVVYDKGKVLMLGGSSGGQATNRVVSIDIANSASPQVTRMADMHFVRAHANVVLLPNDDVMVIGGNETGARFSDLRSIMIPEIFSPASNSWKKVAQMAIPRNYHSTAILLPDARVLSAGGGLCSSPNCSANHQDGQLYSPPYLFNADGSLAERPIIAAAPNIVSYGRAFSLTLSGAGAQNISAFSMIKLSATTHSVNTDLRRLNVAFSAQSGSSYLLTPETNPNVMTPGYWMLFALNAQGVPSEAKIVLVQ